MLAPLDYTNLSDHRRASIAVFKYEAGGGHTPPDQVLGSLFYNPGGPGGSGLDQMRQRSGTGTAAMAYDAAFESRWDIWTWDPRGVEKTWPRADCFQDAETEYTLEILEAAADLYHASSGSIPHQLAARDLLIDACLASTGDTLRFTTTTSTVRDLRALYKAAGDDRLNFIGQSYGTTIGSYFADMFPEEVGRFWLDSVMDVPDYVYGLGDESSFLNFTYMVIRAIFGHCARAGPDHCALAGLLTHEERHSEDRGESVLWDKILAKLDELRHSPQAVRRVDLPHLLTYGLLKRIVYEHAYGPWRWPLLARHLAAGLGNDDWSGFLAEYSSIQRYTGPRKGEIRNDADRYQSNAAWLAIPHADSHEEEPDWTVEDIEDLVTELESEGPPFLGEIQAGWVGRWPPELRGKDHWYGHFNATPSNPILFASNDLDPVTPLSGAQRMAKRFSGSHLLRVEGGIGHGTSALPSKCVGIVVRDWLVRGVLPEPSLASAQMGSGADGPFRTAGTDDGPPAPETVCRPDSLPYMPVPSATCASCAHFRALSKEEQLRIRSEEGFAAVGRLQKIWRKGHQAPVGANLLGRQALRARRQDL